MTDFSTLQSSEAILIDLDRVVHYTMNILYRKHLFLPKIQRICLSQLREHVAQSKFFSFKEATCSGTLGFGCFIQNLFIFQRTLKLLFKLFIGLRSYSSLWFFY